MQRKFFIEELTSAAEVIIDHSKIKKEIRRAQAIYFPNKLNMTLKETAQVMRCSRRTVAKFRRDFYKIVMLEQAIPTPGGRKHENLTAEEENAFLEKIREKAESGKLSTVKEIHKEYEKRIGKKADKSTVYRLLHRHGWRKVAPRRRHPKSDKQAQGAFKRDFPRNHARNRKES